MLLGTVFFSPRLKSHRLHLQKICQNQLMLHQKEKTKVIHIHNMFLKQMMPPLPLLPPPPPLNPIPRSGPLTTPTDPQSIASPTPPSVPATKKPTSPNPPIASTQIKNQPQNLLATQNNSLLPPAPLNHPPLLPPIPDPSSPSDSFYAPSLKRPRPDPKPNSFPSFSVQLSYFTSIKSPLPMPSLFPSPHHTHVPLLSPPQKTLSLFCSLVVLFA